MISHSLYDITYTCFVHCTYDIFRGKNFQLIFMHVFLYIGRDARESHSNLMQWLDMVYSNEGLPCNGLVNTLTRHRKIKGVYHHLSGKEAHEFVKVIQVKLRDWLVQCTIQGLSAGSLLQSTASGRGFSFVLSFVVPSIFVNIRRLG